MADFLANDAYHYTPASSPPSSPVHWDNLSSDATDWDSDNDTKENSGSPWRLNSDPYSANAKATQSPLIHDHHTRQSYATPLTPASSFASYTPSSPTPAPRRKPDFTPNKRITVQDPLWEDVLNDVFKNGTSIIDLDNSNITTIPRAIIDLNSMIPLPPDPEHDSAPINTPETPTRSAIVSAAARSRRVFSQTRSNNTLFSGSPAGNRRGRSERELQIYLANNSLTVLPSELFALKGLVLLSLRGNDLRELPPAIGALSSLRSLNIANNKLTHLPSELSSLTLQTLLVDPNPFLPPPKQPCATSSSRILSPLKIRMHIPKLSELALRAALIQPPKLPALLFTTPTEHALPTPSPSHACVFSGPSASISTLRCIPPHALEISSHYDVVSWLSSLPKISSSRIRAAMQGSEDAKDLYNFCPNIMHSLHVKDNGLFAEPAETRFEWVTSLAGCELAGAVPILWRGCRAGCLAFLDDEKTILKEEDEDEEFLGMFGAVEAIKDKTMIEEAAVEQIVWDEMMDLDD
ncbi:leucine-rich repeat-containing protein 7 [Ceratobasidium sp. AG-Ba]|nr:leucine-rich repeat-containing protein 7 [Ceratobasidium sp. AG-Ba]